MKILRNVVAGALLALGLVGPGNATFMGNQYWVDAVQYGADPTGTNDSSTAINTALAVAGAGGQQAAVRLPPGKFYLKHPITLTLAQTLAGAGHGSTVFKVDQTFDPTATGVIILGQGQISGPTAGLGDEIRDFSISFSQPSDQVSRAAFLPLGSCSSGTGGSGCKYPPAIRLISGSGGARQTISNIAISLAWDGVWTDKDIGGTGNSAFTINNLMMSALDVGLNIDGPKDAAKLNDVRFFNFAIPAAQNLYTVYSDGNTFAAKFGDVESLSAVNFTDFRGRIQISDPSFFGRITNLALDSGNATLEVSAASFLLVSTVDASGTSTGANTHCQIDISGGTRNIITNASFGADNFGKNICVSAGELLVDDMRIKTPIDTAEAVTVSGGALYMYNSHIGTVITARTNPVVHQTGGILAMSNVWFPPISTGSGNVLEIDVDNTSNFFSNNNLNGWGINYVPSTVLGYYDFVDTPFTITATPQFVTAGDFVPANNTVTGAYYLRGNYIDFQLQDQFDTNAYTTASGAFSIHTNMPQPSDGPAPCYFGVISNATLASGFSLCTLAVGASSKADVSPQIVTSNAANSLFTTTNVPPSKTAVKFRVSGRYRIHN